MHINTKDSPSYWRTQLHKLRPEIYRLTKVKHPKFYFKNFLSSDNIYIEPN